MDNGKSFTNMYSGYEYSFYKESLHTVTLLHLHFWQILIISDGRVCALLRLEALLCTIQTMTDMSKIYN